MDKNMRDVPVLLMIFGRPETTLRVFEKLREAKPKRLYVAANGPRADFPDDKERCAAARAIIDQVDWDCEVHKNFREGNIGMQPHWRLALDWFFGHVESGIILEDDCVPDISFFSFSVELLERYRDDERMMHINGSNFQFGRKRGDASYYFSRYPHVWGWATWRRAWKRYDNALSTFERFRDERRIDGILGTERERKYWMRFFESIYGGYHDGSDVKWIYSVWANDGVCITPNANMISNIGYGLDAGHTLLKDKIMDQDRASLLRIEHPHSVSVDKEADAFAFQECFHKSFLQKAVYLILTKAAKLFR